MRTAINIEFTDDEIRKLIEDSARRVGLDFIHSLVGHINCMHPDPSLVAGLAQAVSDAIGAIGKRAAPPIQQQPGAARPVVANTMPPCARLEPNALQDEGWYCCRCARFNGLHRAACRICGHDRCDIVVPPAPSEEGSLPQ